MSTQLLANLRDYLYGTLTPDNMIWLGAQLMEYGQKHEKPQKRFTKEEINAMLDQAEADFAAGRFIDDDDAWDELEELEREEKEKHELAEAV